MPVHRAILPAAAALLVACGVGAGSREPASDTASRPVAPHVSTNPAASGVAKTCPATGLWAECSVLDRLDRGGLAPRRDSAVVSEPPLAVSGTLVRLGTSELELYFYQSAAMRERDEARMDRSSYLDYAAAPGMRPLPTLIHSVNLIAILNSRNDHLRERVGDAITAGPPQPTPP